MTRSIIDLIGRTQAFELMDSAVSKAASDNERLGLPKAITVNGTVMKKYSDGELVAYAPPGTQDDRVMRYKVG